MELSKNYDAASCEDAAQKLWDARKCWHAEPDGRAGRFSVVIPPPNVTGALHLGHALNNTLQDILVRRARMRGLNTVWIPGTDHAGIATQTVVDKRLQQAGELSLKDYKKMEAEGGAGREQFLSKVHAWKDEYEARILGQLKAMGCSCDWDRTAFTMDEPRSRAVREAFFQLFKAGLIYRGKRLVNWDPATQTALADDEVESEEVDGFFCYLKYPLADGTGTVTVATTRPETMLGDTAVAVNPRDPRAAALRGKQVRLPIVNRVVPIIEDEYVVLPVEHGGEEADPKAKFSSGFLKVTPAHDPNDYALGQKHRLKTLNVMAPDASVSLDHGWASAEPAQRDNAELRPFVGLSRETARERIVAWFAEHGLLEKRVPYRHAVGHSYRSHVPVEPYLSDQWYCSVTDPRMAAKANEALAGENRLRFFPERYAKTYEQWHANIRDWCVSRQLWWGHRIPVWSRTVEIDPREQVKPPYGTVTTLASGAYGEPIADYVERTSETAGVHYVCIPTADSKAAQRFEADGYSQDPDVLDTWFSSALWPAATFGWPDATDALDYWNPTSVLGTAREIITLWVSRMVMFNGFLLGRLPFRDVLIHAMIQDGHGQKMSKSLGNGVDPLDVVRTHGADALRFTLATMATQTQDVRIPVDLVDPHTGEAFEPQFFTNKSGYVVMKPVQEHKGKRCVSVYGTFVSEKPTADVPLASNTSGKFDFGRNFCNKLWNAARFVLMQTQEAGPATSVPTLADRWVMSRLARTVEAANAALDEYRFDVYARALYDFVWRDYCDWYVEAAKPALRDAAAKGTTSRTLHDALDAAVRLLHPAAPFITEALYAALGDDRGPAMLAPWPEAAGKVDDDAEAQFAKLQEVVGAIRLVRNEHKADPKKKLPVTLRGVGEVDRALIETLAGCTVTHAGPDAPEPDGAARTTAAGWTIFVEGVIDAAASDKRKAELAKTVAALQGRLSNAGYIDRAPPHLVEQTRQQLVDAERELAELK